MDVPSTATNCTTTPKIHLQDPATTTPIIAFVFQHPVAQTTMVLPRTSEFVLVVRQRAPLPPDCTVMHLLTHAMDRPVPSPMVPLPTMIIANVELKYATT